MPNYTTRPLPVFALQYTGDNAEEIAKEFDPDYYNEIEDGLFYKILCLECGINNHRILCGDYIIRDASGNISVMGEKEFEEGYDERS